MILRIYMVIQIAKKRKVKKKEKIETKWVFEGSAGWLLFWLIVAFPVGIIWLILDMKKKKIK